MDEKVHTTSELQDIEVDSFWENIARSKWGSYKTEVEKRVILKTLNLSKGSGRALEIGCERGRWSKFLVDRG